MNAEKTRRWANAAIAILVLAIAVAVIGELLLPGSKTLRIIGFVAFGMLCVFLRTLPRSFLVPKPKK